MHGTCGNQCQSSSSSGFRALYGTMRSAGGSAASCSTFLMCTVMAAEAAHAGAG